METTKRTIDETIEYFLQLAYEFEKDAHRNNNLESKGKAEAYRMAAFEIERNMKV